MLAIKSAPCQDSPAGAARNFSASTYRAYNANFKASQITKAHGLISSPVRQRIEILVVLLHYTPPVVAACTLVR